MNVLGYLITLMNIQDLHENGVYMKDLTIKVNLVGTLANELRSEGIFNLNDFCKTGYSRVGNVGKYLTKRLRDYTCEGTGSPTEEAVLLTFYFSNQPTGNAAPVAEEQSGMYAHYIHNRDVLAAEDGANYNHAKNRNVVYHI